MGAVVLLTALAGCGGDEGDDGSKTALLVRSDNREKGDPALGSQRIRITPQGRWTPVFQVELEGLRAGERIVAGVGIQVTHCTASDLTHSSHSSCKGTAPYGFNPTVDTKLMLSPRDSSGKLAPGGVQISRTGHLKCTKKLHHCIPVTLGEKKVGAAEAGDSFVVLMVRARDPDAAPCKPPRPAKCNVLQLSHDEGRMGVVRETHSGLDPKTVRAEHERIRALKLAKTKQEKKRFARVLYSIELTDPGPVLIEGRLTAKFGLDYPTPPLVNKQLILADSPHATVGDTVEPQNGENCHGTCRFTQPGLLPCLRRKDLEAGRRYLNLVVFSSRASSYAKRSHRVRIVPGGYLAARQYDAALAPETCGS